MGLHKYYLLKLGLRQKLKIARKVNMMRRRTKVKQKTMGIMVTKNPKMKRRRKKLTKKS